MDEKNINWINTDNRLTVKKHRLDRWSLEEDKILSRCFDSIEKYNFFRTWLVGRYSYLGEGAEAG
jgi:hypothetical protein